MWTTAAKVQEARVFAKPMAFRGPEIGREKCLPFGTNKVKALAVAEKVNREHCERLVRKGRLGGVGGLFLGSLYSHVVRCIQGNVLHLP